MCLLRLPSYSMAFEKVQKFAPFNNDFHEISNQYLLSQQKEQNPLDGVSIAVQEFVEQCTDKIGCVRLYFFIDLYFTPL